MNFLFKFLTFFFIFIPFSIAAPKVVVSIQPIHSLVAHVMEGVGEPTLLLPKSSSPHHFQLRPSDAKLLTTADVFIWVGPELEAFLEKPILSMRKKNTVLTLMHIEGMDPLPYPHPHHHPEHSSHYDPHIWLDPHRAILVVKEIEKTLIALDPRHEKQYRQNTKQTIAKLDKLYAELNASLETAREKPYLVFHEGYQYFNHTFKLNSKGAMIENPHTPFSLHRIKQVKAKIQQEKVLCVFGEPEMNQTIVQQVTEGTQAASGFLDPNGVTLKSGTGTYFILMQNLVRDFKSCFEHSSNLKQKD